MLHVVPHPLFAESPGGRKELREGWADPTPDATTDVVLHVPEALPNSMDAVRQYVADTNIDLVITDVPPGRRPVPPLAAEATRALLEQLDCPVFVVGQLGDPSEVHNLLVPTDLSDPARHAFRHAVSLARLYDAAVHVLHVVESIPYVALTPTDRLSLGPNPLAEHRGRRRLQAFLREGEAAEVPVHAHLAYGDAAEQVCRFPTQTEVDLLVLASHGQGNHWAAPLGQVAERVLDRAAYPLFLVRAHGTSLLATSPDVESSAGAE
jgi:nucleotide-binding universal stress UspA family protein